MSPRITSFYALVLTVSAVLLSALVFPESPDLGLKDTFIAGAIASVLTGFVIRDL
jgi:hypothetical protein